MNKSNKYLGGLAVVLSALALTACNGGGGSSGGSLPPQTQYTFNVYNNSVSSSCTTNGNGFVCTGPLANTSTYTFNYSTSPISYIAIPSQSQMPTGVTITQTGDCSIVPVTNFTCNVVISSTGTASGTVMLYINGSLGQQNYSTIIFQ